MLIAESAVMQTLLRQAAKIAQTDEPVLILGETGTGKDLLARWIHDHSPRGDRPFLPLNCTALPESLIESELFGYRRGAFTDARADKEGLFEAARGGTVFLDEIGDLSPNLQVKLLRVLETHELLPVGAREPVHVDFRLIAATHKDLQKERQAGRFRDDLFYRISVFVLWIPPLRDRLEEIPALATHFAREVNPDLRIAPEVLERLLCHLWPGNVRELRNAIRHAALLADEDGIIRLEHLPDWFQGCAAPEVLTTGSLKDRVQCFERVLLEKFLEDTGGDMQAALRRLGIARSSLYRKLRGRRPSRRVSRASQS